MTDNQRLKRRTTKETLTMDYTLAKELKDAGFPQDVRPSAFGGHALGHFSYGERSEQEEVYLPTLTELIEACGDGFANLHRNRGDGRWDAWDAYSTDESGAEITYGTTPEEAVARLWLALNVKSG